MQMTQKSYMTEKNINLSSINIDAFFPFSAYFVKIIPLSKLWCTESFNVFRIFQFLNTRFCGVKILNPIETRDPQHVQCLCVSVHRVEIFQKFKCFFTWLWELLNNCKSFIFLLLPSFLRSLQNPLQS